jgi:hypothetical protein
MDYRLGYMTAKNKTRKKALSEEEIDKLVELQADDDEAWDELILVSGRRQASLSLPAELAARAAFLAKLHKEQSTKEWLKRIIAERIELEESAFMDFKKELASKRRA